MSDFFESLEVELRAAAERGPRRRPAWLPGAGGVAAGAAVLALLAVALVPALVLLGDGDDPADEPAAVPGPAPVGTVIPKGEGTPPRSEESTVVATGVAPVAGPWQMETYASTRLADPETGEEYQPAGLRCLGIYLLDPPNTNVPAGGGQCGEFPRTPGFGRVQMTVPDGQGARRFACRGSARCRRPGGGAMPEELRELLVYGRVPAEATAVVITVDGVERRRVEPLPGPPQEEGDFYLIPVPPEWENGRVNWLDERGNEGSRGHALMPR
jgi:hypothetical protein